MNQVSHDHRSVNLNTAVFGNCQVSVLEVGRLNNVSLTTTFKLVLPTEP
jgi:hypothetical protein